MTRLLAAELIKLRTTRTFIALAAATVLTSMLITGLVSLFDEPTESSVLSDVFTSDTSSLFIAILAIVGITGEWRHRTITSSLLAAPDRIRFLAAKTVAFAAAGFVLSVAASLALAIVALVILDSRGLPLPELGELVGQIWRNAAVAALLGALGVGLGAVIRVQSAAVVAILMLGFVIEPLVTGLWPEVGRYGPLGSLPVAIQETSVGFGIEGVDLLEPLAATLAMLAWIGALFAVGAVLLVRRDVE
jgi:hypothetical protein